jgi:hypothetical protein
MTLFFFEARDADAQAAKRKGGGKGWKGPGSREPSYY